MTDGFGKIFVSRRGEQGLLQRRFGGIASGVDDIGSVEDAGKAML